MDNSEHKYKITLVYDGTNYCGWQIQPNGVTIQEVLQEKLSIILRTDIEITGASRTDSGVHALAQIAHFSYDQEIDGYRFLASINGILPIDIRVKEIEKMPPSFHARYTATNKVYHYHINLDRVQDPFKRLYCWYFPEKINLEALKACSNEFVGTHDFTSFANEPRVGATARNPVRTLRRVGVTPEKEGVRLEFEGDSFLYKMVRNITGTMIEVGKGKRNVEEIRSILAAKDRRKAGRAAPPHGLFLVRVDYPMDVKEGK
ncbi:MAG TPA: tRNA pseudouridine(38-40) synthase TruA [Waddliaceae bacterium]